MGIDFRNFTLPVNEGIILLVLALIGFSYYFLFKEHHKRNNMKFNEIYPLIISYFVISIISILLIIFGIDIILTGYIFNDEISEVIKELAIGFTIVSVVIINFIFYVKKHRVDLVKEEREFCEKQTNEIGEYLQLIIFALMIIFSIFNIFKYISFIDKAEKYRQIVISLLLIATSIFLLFSMNPIDIKSKIKKLISKSK